MNGHSSIPGRSSFLHFVELYKSYCDLMEESYSYERVEKIANWLLSKTSIKPALGVIAGSGLGGIADQLVGSPDGSSSCPPTVFEYKSIPDFPQSTVEGHDGKLVFGYLSGVPTVCMKGRFHPFEGYPLWKCSMPVRVMKLLGIRILLVTNAAGGCNPSYRVGDIMIIKDHINIPGFAGNNPLKGSNDKRWGIRFPAMNRAYDSVLRGVVKEVSKSLSMDSFIHEGVYCMFGGPCYETVAEIKFIRLIGGDAVGMSTIHEVITALHCGLRVIGLSLITNECVADEHSTKVANHEEVMAVADSRKPDLEKLVLQTVTRFKKEGIL